MIFFLMVNDCKRVRPASSGPEARRLSTSEDQRYGAAATTGCTSLGIASRVAQSSAQAAPHPGSGPHSDQRQRTQ